MTREEILTNWKAHSLSYATIDGVEYNLHDDGVGFFFWAMFPNDKLIVSPLHTDNKLTPGMVWSGYSSLLFVDDEGVPIVSDPIAKIFAQEAAR